MDLPEKSMEAAYIHEPDLSFGHGQTSDHPKDGLFLYGPHFGPTRPKEVSVGVIGSKDGLSYFRNWAIRLGGFVAVPPPGKMDKEHRLHAGETGKCSPRGLLHRSCVQADPQRSERACMLRGSAGAGLGSLCKAKALRPAR